MAGAPSERTVAVVVAAGAASRFGGPRPKQFEPLDGATTVLETSVRALAGHPAIDGVVVVLAADAIAAGRDREVLAWDGVVAVVPGGEARADSVRNGLAAVADAEFVLVHDAARPRVSPALVDRIVRGVRRHGAVVPGLAVSDTVKRVEGEAVRETVDRTTLRLAQTPQAARTAWLREAFDALGTAVREMTDEAAILEAAGRPVHWVEGEADNRKITTRDDLDRARAGGGSAVDLRVGNGFDVHRRVAADSGSRTLVLGGVRFPDERALEGHSDADVILHAAMDALLGAAALGDIGRHFPPTDETWRDADSLDLARRVRALLDREGFEPLNLDLTFLGESPRIGPHADAMRARIGEALGLPVDRIGLKATTLERLGALGRDEGLACQATALVRRRPGAR